MIVFRTLDGQLEIAPREDEARVCFIAEDGQVLMPYDREVSRWEVVGELRDEVSNEER